MTLNEMIEKLNRLMLEESDAIISALRAGQAMRSKFWLDDEIVMVNYDSLWVAGEAWDAALGGDK